MSSQVDVPSRREYELSDITIALERALDLLETIKASIEYASRADGEVGDSPGLRSEQPVRPAVEVSGTPGVSNLFGRSGEQNADAVPRADTVSSSPTLTGREQEVIRLIALGLSNPSIADQLFISTNTVARHVAGIFSKTESENRVQAANYAREHSLLD